MDEEHKKLGGLIETAEEHQAAVTKAVALAEAAGERLERAARQWEDAGARVVRACSTAIGEAVTAEAQTLAARIEAPFVVPVQRLEQAASAMDQAVRRIQWPWLATTFLLGMLAGMGLLWWGLQPRLNRLLEYASATYEQTAPKMPSAPASVAPKKGGK